MDDSFENMSSPGFNESLSSSPMIDHSSASKSLEGGGFPTTNVVDVPSNDGKRRKTSKCWNHFTMEKKGGKEVWACNYCNNTSFKCEAVLRCDAVRRRCSSVSGCILSISACC